MKATHFSSIIIKGSGLVLLWAGLLLPAGQVLAQGSPAKVEQLTDEQIEVFLKKALDSGLSESQIEQLALRQGYTQSDIARMRERISTLDKAPAETPTQRSSRVQSGRRTISDAPPGTLSDTLPKKPLMPEGRDTLPEQTPRLFGASFFELPAATFEPNLKIATPKNYSLGPDDQLLVSIYGASVKNYTLDVSPEGTVSIENSGPIQVSGLSIEQARDRIAGVLKRLYGLGGVGINVTLGNVRSIQVTVTGEVKRPGRYTVSSLASLFNAIYSSGGPTENGTFRRIQVRREGKLFREVDLYQFLLSGDEQDNIGLRDQDVIFFPDYETHVTFQGEVRRPMIFEIKPGEHFRDALRFAGGFNDRAYRASVGVQRNLARERQMLMLDEAAFADFVPQNGDVYMVGKILERFENRVSLKGAVLRPGDYALSADTRTVKQLIEKADGLREDAFLLRGLIERRSATLQKEVLSFDIGKLLSGQVADIPLRREDVITIHAIDDFHDNQYVVISGAVNQPDTLSYAAGMSVADLVTLAGGFAEGATGSRVEVSRRIRYEGSTPDSTTIQTFIFNIDKSLTLGTADATFKLQPYDVVVVRYIPGYEVQRQVHIRGEVLYPSPYVIKGRDERISDLIRRAGGLTSEAYLPGAQFTRRGELVAIDLSNLLSNPAQADNLRLESGDELMIPKRSQLVRIQGSVLMPALVSYVPQWDISDYIQQAGGLTDDAWRKKIYVTYPNGRVRTVKSLVGITRSPQVQPGTVITVPAKTRKGKRMETGERIAIFSLAGTLLIATSTILSVLFKR